MSTVQSHFGELLSPWDIPAAQSSTRVIPSAPSSLFLVSHSADLASCEPLSVALIGPDLAHRAEAAEMLYGCQLNNVKQFSDYPPRLDDLPRMIGQHHDVVIIDLDSDPEFALDLVENICVSGAATVMVYSAKTVPDLMVRCMRAGAREYLTLPFTHDVMMEALVRAAARRPQPLPGKKTNGKLLVFMGTKGGAGVTTLACNFAVALAQEPGQSTLLIDLDLPLGDAALNLGIVSEFSTVNALQAADRLDAAFLSRLLVKHSTGASVLAAPGRFPLYVPENEALDKLLAVARQEFDNVVVDAGSSLDFSASPLFRQATRVYMVTQAGIPELRNSNRMISQYFSSDNPKLEVVLNRYEPRLMGVTEEHITKALTRPAHWKVPNDHALVRRNQINATPLVLGDSNLAKLIRQMARSVTGQPDISVKKKGFGLFSKSN